MEARAIYQFDGQDTFRFRSPHGMIAAKGRLRLFGGVEVRHLQHFDHPGRAWHDLSGQRDTLSIVLAEVGGRCEARTHLRSPVALDLQRPHHISFVPAEMHVWGYTDHIESVRELRLSFDRNVLEERLGPDLASGKATKPALMFQDPRVVACARLLAVECDVLEPNSTLYGDGLMLALLSACFAKGHQQPTSGLSSVQLRRVLDYLDAHLVRPVSLAELAALADLSPSQFARQFKASTDVTPYRYHLDIRIGKVQDLLLKQDEPLSLIAAATGFADQSHLTRVFKRVTGSTPNAWRRDRASLELGWAIRK